MDGLDDPEATGRAPPRADLFVTWWERALAGIVVALLMALVVDIVVYC
jgi:hypothetical protein